MMLSSRPWPRGAVGVGFPLAAGSGGLLVLGGGGTGEVLPPLDRGFLGGRGG